jgi:hypothetical protein
MHVLGIDQDRQGLERHALNADPDPTTVPVISSPLTKRLLTNIHLPKLTLERIF